MTIKNNFSITVFLLVFVIFSNLHSVELNWLHDYDKALIEAKKEHKDVYLFVGADVCRFCDKFKETTLQDSKLLKRLKEDYVVLYMSRDRHQIPKKFETAGVPRHYFLDAEGEMFYKTWGGREVDGFYSVLDEAELNKDE